MSLGNCAALKWVAQNSRRVILSEADVGFVLLGADIVVRHFEDKYSGFSIAIQVFFAILLRFLLGRGIGGWCRCSSGAACRHETMSIDRHRAPAGSGKHLRHDYGVVVFSVVGGIQ